MKYAFVTVTDANYSLYTNSLLHSLKKAGHTEKMYIIQSGLAEPYKNNFRKLYPDCDFLEVDYPLYKEKGKDEAKFYKFEMFKLREFDKLIYIDSDIVVLKSFKDFIEKEIPEMKFAMIRENHRACYNAGLIVVDKEYLTDAVYTALINYPWSDREFGHDQQIFNKYFDGRIHKIHSKYNWFVADPPPDMNEIVALHYFIKDFTESDRKRLSPEMHSLWFKFYHEVQEILK